MSGGRLSLRPMLWPSILTLLGLVVLTGLGVWQLERREWKQDLIATLEVRASAPAVAFPVDDDDPRFEFQRARITGRFLHEHEFHLLNRTHEGRVGLHLVTPLVRSDGGGAVLVDRGWVPVDRRDPTARPESRPAGEVRVEGFIRRFTAKGRFVPENDPASNAWFHIDRDRMTRAAGLDRVAPLYLTAAPGEDPSPLPIGTSPGIEIRNSHLGYAITWFALAVTLAGVYVAFHMRGRK